MKTPHSDIEKIIGNIIECAQKVEDTLPAMKLDQLHWLGYSEKMEKVARVIYENCGRDALVDFNNQMRSLMDFVVDASNKLG